MPVKGNSAKDSSIKLMKKTWYKKENNKILQSF